MTQGYLVEAIGFLLAQITARWPDRVTRVADGLHGAMQELGGEE